MGSLAPLFAGRGGRERRSPRHAPAERGRDGVGASLRRVEIRHPCLAERGTRLRGFGHQEHRDRLVGAGAVDDGLHGKLRIEPCRGADHHHHEIELRCHGQNVERRLHDLVAGARERQIDEPRARHLDAGGIEPRIGRLARRHHVDPAARQRVDHHGGAACRGGDDGRAGRAPVAPRRHARQQRQALDERREGFHPGDAAVAQKGVGDVVLAGERARVGHGELAPLLGTAELVGEHRLAGGRSALREGPQRVGVAQRLEEQQVAVDIRIIERGAADFAERKVDLVADRHQPGKPDAAGLAARQEGADHAAGVGGGENAPHRQVRLVERGVRGEQRAVAQVDDAEARWADDAQACRRDDLAQPSLAFEPDGAHLGKPVGQHGRDRDTGTCTRLDRLHHAIDRRHDVGVLRRFRQRVEGGPRLLAEHLVASRIDRIDAPRKARLPQEFQRPSGGLAGVVRLPDESNGARREEGVAQLLFTLPWRGRVERRRVSGGDRGGVIRQLRVCGTAVTPTRPLRGRPPPCRGR
jgi:hypothetical protein